MLSNRTITLHKKRTGLSKFYLQYRNTDVHQLRYVRSAVGPKHKLVINIVLILIAERDRSGVEGHNSSYRKEINENSSVVHGKNVYIINLCNGLTAARHSIFMSNDYPVICLYIHTKRK